MMKTNRWIPAAGWVALCLVLGCSSGDEKAAKDAGAKVEEASEEVRGEVNEAVETAEGAMDEAKGDMEEAVETAEGGLKDVMAEGEAKMAESRLLDWRALNETAPDVYKARFETTKGDFIVEVQRQWAPRGADRFYNLVKSGFYDECRFFRVLSGFMAQIGINGDPKVSSVWQAARFPDDAVKKNNTRGMVSFATGGPNTRTTQIFINFGDNSGSLDPQGFSPFGMVDEEGMKVVDSLYADYGEGAPRGPGPNQAYIQARGNAYLEESFPKLDYVKKATIVK